MLLHRLAGPLQLELDTYCELLEEAPVSKQAFSMARAFICKFADRIAEVSRAGQCRALLVRNAPDYYSWNRYCAGKQCGTQARFGCSEPKRDAATALGSLACGPLNHAIYNCQIAPYATDKRDLAKLYMTRLQELELEGSLLLFDRWYSSVSFLAYTINAGFFFIMRVREKWNLQVDAVKTEDWVTLIRESKDYSVRVDRLCADSALRPESAHPDRSPASKSPS